jgi:hypothetical protein
VIEVGRRQERVREDERVREGERRQSEIKAK